MKWFARLARWRPSGWWQHPDVSDCVAVLPVLRAQLQEIAQIVEQSVVKVCSNFTTIADRSRKAVDKTAELLGGSQQQHNAGVEQSIETSRVTIGSLLERLERSATVSGKVVSRMEQVEKAMGGIQALLAELQRIAFSNKLVALNAKIEAVHVGQLGSGFEVVADEIARQGDRSNALAEEIGSRVREMSERVNAASIELRVLVADNCETLIQSRRDAEGALDLLWSVHQRARDSMAVMVAENSHLAGQISEAVVGLQFQDRTTQCLSHVVEALEKVEKNLGGAPRPSLFPVPQSLAREGSLLDDVRQTYSMDSERAVMARSLQEQPDDSSGGDVELF